MRKGSEIEGAPQGAWVLNAVPLQNAVLCAECDVVSDSPHDTCLVCGSHSLFNIAHVFGGKLPKERASLLVRDVIEVSAREIVWFPKSHRLQARATAGSRQLPVVALDRNQTDEAGCGMLLGPEGR
ncbi:MAG TPA: hypothetical protein VEK33_10575 [Terriglobales bacterium]|nr:hypothetical protein [Terriglobales bacterium]